MDGGARGLAAGRRLRRLRRHRRRPHQEARGLRPVDQLAGGEDRGAAGVRRPAGRQRALRRRRHPAQARTGAQQVSATGDRQVAPTMGDGWGKCWCLSAAVHDGADNGDTLLMIHQKMLETICINRVYICRVSFFVCASKGAQITVVSFPGELGWRC